MDIGQLSNELAAYLRTRRADELTEVLKNLSPYHTSMTKRGNINAIVEIIYPNRGHAFLRSTGSGKATSRFDEVKRMFE